MIKKWRRLLKAQKVTQCSSVLGAEDKNVLSLIQTCGRTACDAEEGLPREEHGTGQGPAAKRRDSSGTRKVRLTTEAYSEDISL